MRNNQKGGSLQAYVFKYIVYMVKMNVKLAESLVVVPIQSWCLEYLLISTWSQFSLKRPSWSIFFAAEIWKDTIVSVECVWKCGIFGTRTTRKISRWKITCSKNAHKRINKSIVCPAGGWVPVVRWGAGRNQFVKYFITINSWTRVYCSRHRGPGSCSSSVQA